MVSLVELSSNRMCPATRCVQQPDVFSNQMCSAIRCVQFMVSLLYISQTYKIIYTLMLRCSLKIFLFHWELRRSENMYLPQLSIVYCFVAYKIIFCSIESLESENTTFHCPLLEAYKMSSIESLESENIWPQPSIVIINHWSVSVLSFFHVFITTPQVERKRWLECRWQLHPKWCIRCRWQAISSCP